MSHVSHQKRVFLWTNPRSLSTAFTRCMENVPNIKICFEPFSAINHCELKGRFVKADKSSDARDCLYQATKDQLESPFKKFDLIFVKDMGYDVDGKYNMLPPGYQHTFLIRHPAKTMRSLYELYLKGAKNGEDAAEILKSRLPSGFYFKELFNLYEYIAKSGETTPIVIDADDLQEFPEHVIREYCRGIGVNFHPHYLHWGVGSSEKLEIPKCLQDSKYQYFDESLKSGGFKKRITRRTISTSELPKEIVDVVEKSIPYYEKMYALRSAPVTQYEDPCN